MGNDLSTPDVPETTPRVDATSEFRKRCRRHRDLDKESIASTRFLSELLEWDDDDDDTAVEATVPPVRKRAVKKYYFETLDEEGNRTVLHWRRCESQTVFSLASHEDRRDQS
jgi:hypothetical protein